MTGRYRNAGLFVLLACLFGVSFVAIKVLLIRQLGPVRTDLVAYLVPVVASVTGWLLLGERVSLATAVGFLIVVAGVVQLERDVVGDEVARLSRAVGADVVEE